MLVFVRKIVPYTDALDFPFIRAQVIFHDDHDDEQTPENEITVDIYIERDDKLTFDQKIELAIDRAHRLLGSFAQVRLSEYRRSRSSSLCSDSKEGIQ